MTRKKSTPQKPNSKNGKPELAVVWATVDHISRQDKQGALTPAIRAAISPFMSAAVELALAAIANPHEDTNATLEKACLELDAAVRKVPWLADLPDPLLTTDAADLLQKRLVRHVVTITRAFSIETVRPAPAGEIGPKHEPYAPKRAADLDDPDPCKRWMIDRLWQRSGTGIVGGGAKGCKTWLSLDIALSVASGSPALDSFHVHQSGSVLYISAEGGEAYVKDRLESLCVHRRLSLESLPHEIHVIPNAIRIDTPAGLGRLEATIRSLRPTLVVLDPLVRLHRLDENSASSISGLLSSLTELQQAHDVAIILVHHSTKQSARRAEMSGQDFRGSGDLHAWGDSNIFMRRKGNRVLVSAEHRAAPSPDRWTLRPTNDERPRLEIVSDDHGDDSTEAGSDGSSRKLDSDIYELLKLEPHSGREVRSKVPGGTERILASLKRLEGEKKITRVGRRWAVTNGSTPGS